MVLHVALVTDNNIGVEGAKALGPHLATLVNMNKLDLCGRKRGWDVCVCVVVVSLCCCCDKKQERLCVLGVGCGCQGTTLARKARRHWVHTWPNL